MVPTKVVAMGFQKVTMKEINSEGWEDRISEGWNDGINDGFKLGIIEGNIEGTLDGWWFRWYVEMLLAK